MTKFFINQIGEFWFVFRQPHTRHSAEILRVCNTVDEAIQIRDQYIEIDEKENKKKETQNEKSNNQ